VVTRLLDNCSRGNEQEGSTDKRFLPVSKTSTVTEVTNVLPIQQMFFGRGITMPGHSEVSLAATTPCRLQLCAALEGQLASYLGATLPHSTLYFMTPVIIIILLYLDLGSSPLSAAFY